MFKYYAVASALKFFSLNKKTETLYRKLGNLKGSQQRLKQGLPKSYVQRARTIMEHFETYQIPLQEGHYLELGTGWVHWESLILSLLYQGQFSLYDVWDCRQFQALQRYLRQLNVQHLPLSTSQKERALERKVQILEASSMAELYQKQNFEYVCDPLGHLQGLPEEDYDVCYSYNVLEHIPQESVASYLKHLYRLLKPGAYSMHLIDLSDHLAHYDKSVCGKNYLSYSDKSWNLLLNNKLQYFNRIQRPHWLDFFQAAGFELLEEKYQGHEMKIPIAPQYQHLSVRDLNCTSIYLIHRKPLDSKPVVQGCSPGSK